MPEENQDLPMDGLDHKKIAPLTKAVKEYHTHKTARVDALVKEKAAKATVLELMHRYEDELGKGPDGELYYRTGDLVCTVTPGKDKLKVKDADEADAEEDE
jgi:hypothetical protein